MKPLIWAHRGASARESENTMPAFRLAETLGADGLELDVRLTADNEIVVIHDDTLDRVTDGAGPVAARTLPDLRRLKVHVNAGDTPSQIPTLREVLEFARSTRLLLNIEIKEPGAPNPLLSRGIAALVSEYGLDERTIYCSFNHYSLMELRKNLPSARVGLLYGEALFEPWHYAKKLGAYALHPNYHTIFDKDYIDNCHRMNIAVNVWTVDDEEIMRRMISWGADSLITNMPDRARAVIEGAGCGELSLTKR